MGERATMLCVATRAIRSHGGQLAGAVNAVFNPGVTEFGGGTLLLARVEDRTGISHLAVATSADGLGDWIVERTGVCSPISSRMRSGSESRIRASRASATST